MTGTHKGNDYEIIDTAINWLDQLNQQPGYIYFITVVKTWGSSPRPVGSIMAINHNGLTTGSVSGGCIEQTLSKKLANSHSNHFPILLKYGINKKESQRFGLPCGGSLELVVEKLDNAAQLRPLQQSINQHRRIVRHICLATGEISFSSRIPDIEFEYNTNSINRVFGPDWRLLIIGAGHLSQIVATMALTLDYHVIICDPRENYKKNWPVEHTEFETDMPDDVVKKIVTNTRCAVLALTHDPNLDDTALMEALDSSASYVGALGSQSTNDSRRHRLKALGVSKEGIEKLHGPIGLPIGSHTPAEIAISIFAELTAFRNGKILKLINQQAHSNQYLQPAKTGKQPHVTHV